MLDRPNTVMTDDARKRLTILDSEGHSASAISKALWTEFGIYKTRNAVIGMIHRMGLRKTRGQRATKWMVSEKGDIISRAGRVPDPRPAKPLPEPVRKQSRVSNNHVGGRALRPASVAAPAVPVEPPPVGGVGLLDLQHHHCRALLGRGADGLAVFCGADKASGSYCAEHGRMFYIPAKQVSERVADFLAGKWTQRRGPGDERRSVDRYFAERHISSGRVA